MERRIPVLVVLVVVLLGSFLVVLLPLPAGATPPRVERVARSVPATGKPSPVSRRPGRQKLVRRISRAHVNRPLARMRRCLREVLRGRPGTSGRVVVRIVVDAVTGKAISWTCSVPRSRAAVACVERAVRRLRIPVRGRRGGSVIVTMPFKYR
jgi:hypothetical protein